MKTDNEKIFSSLDLSNDELGLISNLVYTRFGIVLGERKRALIIGRLQKILRTNQFESFRDYYDYVVNESSGEALLTLIDRISTNHTFFFRENDHFEYFISVVLPEIAAKNSGSNKKKLKIWVPGCSSGEEPYTLAFLMMEYFGNSIKDWDAGILATDISTGALKKSIEGSYEAENVEHLPRKYILKYFIKRSDGTYMVNDAVKSKVLYRRLNLIQDSYPFKGLFDVIFCRNVMIYFDNETRQNLVARFAQYSDPSAYLFIGHSESIGRNDPNYRYIRPAIYRRIP